MSKKNVQLIAEVKAAVYDAVKLKESFEQQIKEQTYIALDLVESIEKYGKFFLHRIEDVPRLLQVFRDRGSPVPTFERLINEKQYPRALLITLQTLCDFIVSEGEKSRTVEKSAQTIVHRPMSIISEIDGSAASKTVHSKGKHDREYTKMMNESDQLLATISAQSQRIANLNSQLYTTISQQPGRTSARLLDHYRGAAAKKEAQMKLRTANSGTASPTGSREVLHLDEWENVQWKRLSPVPYGH